MKKIKTITLLQFSWKGLNQNGKPVEGSIEARSLSAAKALLRQQNISVKKISQKSQLLQQLMSKRIKPVDIASFSRQMATMISAGIPLVQGLSIVAKGVDNPNLSRLILDLRSSVENGSTFADALAKHSNYFDPLFCNLIEAGEQSGTLDIMLERIATYREKTESIKKKIRKALSYPIAVIVIAFIVTTILLVKVIPQFETLFNNVGAGLPTFTQIVINISEVFQDFWWMIALGAIAMVGLIYFGRKRSRKFCKITDGVALRTPVFGTLLQKASIARFCRTLATTFAAGMPLINALRVSSKAAGNLVYEDAILQIRENVTSGEQFHQAMEMTKRFPNIIIQMAAIGEEAGELDAMMNKSASIYEEDVDTMVDSLSSLLEPAIMAILGILVGGLVIAMYLPIFKMGQVV